MFRVGFSTLKGLFKDVSVFGLSVAFKALFQEVGSDNIVLDIPEYGRFTIRRGDSDYAVIRQTVRDKEYSIHNASISQHLQLRYKEILSSGRVPVVVDAGANIGVSAVWFAKQFEDAEIVAIEPDTENARLAKLNCSGCSRIHVHEAAIGAVSGYVSVLKGGDSWATQTERADSGSPIITMSDAVNTVENGELFIAKIDIEGFEADLFENNCDWVDSAVAIFIEPHDWLFPGRGTSKTFQSVMGSRGYEIFISGENLLYVNFKK